MRNNGGAGEDREIEKKREKEMEFNQEYIQHFAHKQHILKLLMCNGQCCMICDERIYGPSYAMKEFMVQVMLVPHHHVCSISINLVVSCSEKYITHFITIIVWNSKNLSSSRDAFYSSCNGSEGSLDHRIFTYRCQNCRFHLHPHCVCLKPNVKYEGHEHPLTIVEAIDSVL